MPTPAAYCVSPALSPFGLVGLRSQYKNGVVEAFAIEQGDTATILASRLYPDAKIEDFPGNNPPQEITPDIDVD